MNQSKPQGGNTVYVFADPTPIEGAPEIIRVYWKTGSRNRNAVDIRLGAGCTNPGVAAELVAIRYLVGKAHIFGRNKTGSTLKLVFSSGAVKRLVKKTSDNTLSGYSLPFLTRYAGAEFGVSKDRSWFPSAEELAELGRVIQIDGEDFNGPEMIEAGEVGRIAITEHSLQRYMEYTKAAGLGRAWISLKERLGRGLVCKPLKDSVLKHKLLKYGELPEIWGHPDSEMNFVLCPNNRGYKTLVTVFQRNPSEDVPRFLPSYVNS